MTPRRLPSGRWHAPRHRPASEAPIRQGILVTRVALYRWYGATGQLLYVGTSNNPVGRTGDHADNQPWWATVSRATVDWFDSRADAEAAEGAAIRTERPLHNVRHSSRRTLVGTRLAAAELAWVDDRARQEGTNRSEALRRIIRESLALVAV